MAGDSSDAEAAVGLTWPARLLCCGQYAFTLRAPADTNPEYDEPLEP
jgi:hypothetical protein